MVLGLKMFLKKLTQEQRIRLRAQRKESQLIRNRAKERSDENIKNIHILSFINITFLLQDLLMLLILPKFHV